MTNEEAINRLKTIRSIHNGSYAQEIDMAIEALEQPRWIPVSEKNPETTGEYLTTIKWRDDKNGYNYAVVKRDYFADVETWNDSFVIAWQSIPQPYKESEND